MKLPHAIAGALLGATLTAQGILPPPPVPAGNPLTPARSLLGKALFWDEQLSSSRSVACGTCHVFATGGSDPRAVPALHPGPDGQSGTPDDVHGSPGVVRHDAQGRFTGAPTFGIRAQVTGRKAPAPINAGYHVATFWDGRAGDVFRDPVTGAVVLPSGGALESQIAGPPVNDVEMSHVGRSWTDIATDLAPLRPLALADQVPAALQAFVQGHTYASLFAQVFGSPGVTPVRIVFAIASYERTLVSDQSPFDRFLAGQGTLTLAEQRGLNEFRGMCTGCHTDVDPPVLATGPVLHDFRNVGVRPLADDLGRFNVTNVPLDQGRFKVPGLRNVALRAPYFHTGGMPTLGDVVDFYSRGGDFHVNQDPLVFNIPGMISVQDKQDLLAFFATLTDPRVAAEQPPFDRPRLWSEGANVPSVFGQGTAGTGGFRPRSVALLPAHAGNPRFTIGVDRTLPGALHFLAWDVAAYTTPTVLFGQNVHLAMTPSLAFVGMPQLTQGSGTGGGWGASTFAIPAGLAGTFFGQWLVFDAQGPNGITVSDAFGLPVF
jgi:cytochrome c peroxidase